MAPLAPFQGRRLTLALVGSALSLWGGYVPLALAPNG